MQPLTIKDVIHLYIGCEATFMTGVHKIDFLDAWKFHGKKLMPHLYHLKDMTFEDAKEIGLVPAVVELVEVMADNGHITFTYSHRRDSYTLWYRDLLLSPSQTVRACKLGYDLFQLIERGEAKDKKKMV